jgi:hypothetical protein
MQLSQGQHQQYDSQFQENGAPAITGTRIWQILLWHYLVEYENIYM